MNIKNIEPQKRRAAPAGSPKSKVQRREPKVQTPSSKTPTVPASGFDPPEWWTRLPAGERVLIRAVLRMLRSARRSRIREVARAAVKWERGINCFIKVRLMNARPWRHEA